MRSGCGVSLARSTGRVLLRIEDHDRGRCRPEYEEALLEDLAWLGLVPDLGPTRQRDAGAMYLDTLAALEQRGLVYACDCSRRDISREAGDVPHLETPYSGRCRDRGLVARRGPRSAAPARANGRAVHRRTARRAGADARHSSAATSSCGIATATGPINSRWWWMTCGRGWTWSCAAPIWSARPAGRSPWAACWAGTIPPVYLHHPLLHRPDGAKLSKAAGDTGIRELRAAGVPASEVLGRAARRGGPHRGVRPIGVDDLPGLFTGA